MAATISFSVERDGFCVHILRALNQEHHQT